MPPAKKYTKKTKKITLAEFRAWLEGVEELQPKDWVPNASQWKLIRNKVNCIVEPEPEVIEVPVAQPAQSGPQLLPPAPQAAQQPAGRIRVPVPQAEPAGWNSIGIGPAGPAAPAGPSALDGLAASNAAPVAPPPAASEQVMNVGGKSVPGVKTPDIDTSQGNFESSFG